MRGSPPKSAWETGGVRSPLMRGYATPQQADDDWLEEAKREVSIAAERRATRAELADQLVQAMQGNLDGLEEIVKMSPAEKVVVTPDTTAMTLAPYIATMKHLKHLQSEVGELKVIERIAAAKETVAKTEAYYQGKVARREDKIRALQQYVVQVQDEVCMGKRGVALLRVFYFFFKANSPCSSL